MELFGLPAEASIGFVTGTQMAHVTGLAAARFHVLDAAGWDVGADGLTGAPPVRVLAGEKRHVTVDRALRLLGLGAPTVVAADDQGRLVVDALGEALGDGPTIVCAQAGEVNTGAFDPLPEIADACEESGAWLHVDGAFGLWAAATPRPEAPRRGHRARRLVDDRRAQVAERALRLRDRLLRAPRVAPRGDDDHRLVPDPGRGCPARARPGRLGAGVLAPGARVPGLRGPALARPERHRGARRALLRRRDALRGGDRRAARRRAPERGRPEPGALPLRVGRADGRRLARGAGERRGLDERHHLGRAQGDPRVGLELADRRRGDRPRGRALSRLPTPARRPRGRPGPRASGRRSLPATSRSR